MLAGVNAAKVRKDLSLLGSFGTRGTGYDVAFLLAQIDRALGAEDDWPVLVVGIGNLGTALVQLRGLRHPGIPRPRAVRRRPGRGRPHGRRAWRSARWRRCPQLHGLGGSAIGVVATPARGGPGGDRRTGGHRGDRHLELRPAGPERAAPRAAPPRRPRDRAPGAELLPAPPASGRAHRRAGGDLVTGAVPRGPAHWTLADGRSSAWRGAPALPPRAGSAGGPIQGGVPRRVRRRRRARARAGAARRARAGRGDRAPTRPRCWPACATAPEPRRGRRAVDLPAHRGLRGGRPLPRRRVRAPGVLGQAGRAGRRGPRVAVHGPLRRRRGQPSVRRGGRPRVGGARRVRGARARCAGPASAPRRARQPGRCWPACSARRSGSDAEPEPRRPSPAARPRSPTPRSSWPPERLGGLAWPERRRRRRRRDRGGSPPGAHLAAGRRPGPSGSSWPIGPRPAPRPSADPARNVGRDRAR